MANRRFVTKNNRHLTQDCGVTLSDGTRGKVAMLCHATGEVLVNFDDGSAKWRYASEMTTEHGIAVAA